MAAFAVVAEEPFDHMGEMEKVHAETGEPAVEEGAEEQVATAQMALEVVLEVAPEVVPAELEYWAFGMVAVSKAFHIQSMQKYLNSF